MHRSDLGFGERIEVDLAEIVPIAAWDGDLSASLHRRMKAERVWPTPKRTALWAAALLRFECSYEGGDHEDEEHLVLYAPYAADVMIDQVLPRIARAPDSVFLTEHSASSVPHVVSALRPKQLLLQGPCGVRPATRATRPCVRPRGEAWRCFVERAADGRVVVPYDFPSEVAPAKRPVPMTTPPSPALAPSAHPLPDITWGPVVARLLADGGVMTFDDEGGWELDCTLPETDCFHLFEGVHDQLVWSDDDGRRTALFDGAGNDVDDEMTCSLRTAPAPAARAVVVSSTHWQAGTSYWVFAAATDEGFERALRRARALIAEQCCSEEDDAFAEECAAYDAYCWAQEAAEQAATPARAEHEETP